MELDQEYGSFHWGWEGVSENRGHYYSTLNRRIRIIRTPKEGTPNSRKLPYKAPSRIRAMVEDGILSGLRCGLQLSGPETNTNTAFGGYSIP